MKEVHFQRAAIATLPSPIQLSSDTTLAIVTKSGHAFQLLDLITNTTLNISTSLTNELMNLVLYNEEISTSTNISETEITQLRWLGTDLCALTNNLNLIIMRRTSLQRTDYAIRFNINKLLIEYYKLDIEYLIRFEDLQKLRIHSFAIPGVDIHSDVVNPNYIAIGLENGSITIINVAKEDVEIVIESIPIGSYSIIGLEWSNFNTDGISYLAITLSDNAVFIQKLKFDGSKLQTLELNQIRPLSKLKVPITKWDHDDLLSVVSTNCLQCHRAGTGVNSEIEIGTLYAITNVCYLPGDGKILLANTHNYIGIFSQLGSSRVEKLFAIDYNSAKSIDNINDTSLTPLKKKLITLNTKYTNISIRGVLIDPLQKSLFIAFANNDPPIEHRRMKLMSFKLQQILLSNTLTLEEIQNINFSKLNVKYIIQFLINTKFEFEWVELLKLVKFKTVEIPKDKTFLEIIDLNLEKNATSLSILQIIIQLKIHLNLNWDKDVDLEILKFISSIVVTYIDEHQIDLTNKYDLSILQSYRSIHEMKTTSHSAISLTFQQGRFTEVFKFGNSDLSTIVSITNEIPFKRCGITLLPLTELNNLKCEICGKSFINLENLHNDEIGIFTIDILKKFTEKCIYSGDHLYKSY